MRIIPVFFAYFAYLKIKCSFQQGSFLIITAKGPVPEKYRQRIARDLQDPPGKTAGCPGNKTPKGLSAESLVKYSDKVDPESKDTVKHFLQKMILNIERYD